MSDTLKRGTRVKWEVETDEQVRSGVGTIVKDVRWDRRLFEVRLDFSDAIITIPPTGGARTWSVEVDTEGTWCAPCGVAYHYEHQHDGA